VRAVDGALAAATAATGALASASGGRPAGVGHTGVTGIPDTGRGVPSGIEAWPCWTPAMSSSLG